MFGKFANTLCGDGDPIVLSDDVDHVDAEAELAVLIGEAASGLKVEGALDVVAGYTYANDRSARDAQFSDGRWFRGKGPSSARGRWIRGFGGLDLPWLLEVGWRRREIV